MTGRTRGDAVACTCGHLDSTSGSDDWMGLVGHVNGLSGPHQWAHWIFYFFIFCVIKFLFSMINPSEHMTTSIVVASKIPLDRGGCVAHLG